MTEWFALQSEYTFETFSISHRIVLAITVIGFFIMFVTHRSWPEHPIIYKTVKWMLFGLLIISEISYQIWTFYHNIWSFNLHSPLHLCGIASIIAVSALLFKKKLLIQLAFFFGVIPAFLALITPDLLYDYHHFRFWKFFIHHTSITWACMFLALSKPNSITFRSVLTSYSFLLLYAFLIGYFVNPMTGANYLYLKQPPYGNTLLNYFGDNYMYYLNLCLTTLICFLIQYLVWRLLIKKRQKFDMLANR